MTSDPNANVAASANPSAPGIVDGPETASAAGGDGAARTLDASRRYTLLHVQLRAALPGYLISQAGDYLNMSIVFAGIITIAVIGLLRGPRTCPAAQVGSPGTGGCRGRMRRAG
jgi:hypothetical protein